MTKKLEINLSERIENKCTKYVNIENNSIENQSETADPVLEIIRREHEEKARNRIERGDFGYHPNDKNYPLINGDGEYASTLRATLGETEQIHLQHLRSLRLADEDRYPEIYSWKRGARSKNDNYQHSPTGNGKSTATHITKEQFIDLYSAVSFANGFGVAVNVHIIIQWGHLGYIDHSEAAKVLQDGFFKPLHGWYAYNSGTRQCKYGVKNPHQLFWIYSHECSRMASFHTHIIAGIPIEMREAFRIWVRDRMTALSKKQPVSKGAAKIVGPPSSPIERQWILFQYLCKGLDPKAMVNIPQYEKTVPMSNLIQFHYRNPGHIDCKNRIGMSRNLTRTEREKYGFKSLAEQGVFDKRRLYTSELFQSWHEENPSSCGHLALLSF